MENEADLIRQTISWCHLLCHLQNVHFVDIIKQSLQSLLDSLLIVQRASKNSSLENFVGMSYAMGGACIHEFCTSLPSTAWILSQTYDQTVNQAINLN